MSGARASERPFAIYLLGAPQIRWQDNHWDLPRRQARAFIYRLAASSEPVSRQHLSFLFWADQPERLARRNLNRLLSYVNHKLPHPDLLNIQDEWLQLNFELCRSDLLDFYRLSRALDQSSLHAVLDGVKLPMLDGFYLDDSPEYDRWVSEERSQCEQAVLQAFANSARQALRAKDYSRAITAASRYLQIDNLVEEIHRLLMQAYLGTGNRSAALQQFEQLAVELERELGVEPLPETQALHQAIRSGNYTPAAIHQPTEALVLRPGLALPFTGREKTLVKLKQAVVAAEEGGMVLIAGEAGIGKTRLLQAFSAEWRGSIVTASCHPATQRFAFHPVIQALRNSLQYGWKWRAVPPIWLSEVSTLLPEIHSLFPELPDRLQLAPDLAQARLLEAITQVFIQLAKQSDTLVLILDDLHWLDKDSQTWLEYLIEHLPRSRITVLGTYRSENAESVVDLRRAAERSGCLTRFVLAGLDLAGIKQMLQHLPPQQVIPDSLPAALQRATNGNPFYILEILGALLENSQELSDDQPIELPVPAGLSELVRSRLQRLTAVERQVIETAAVIEPITDPILLQSVAGRSDQEVAEALEALTVRNYLKSGQLSIQFRHEIIRSSVYKLLSPWRKQLLHRRTARALAEQPALLPEGLREWQAFHFALGGEIETAVQAFERAAQENLQRYAYQAALDNIQQALALHPERPAPDADRSRQLSIQGQVLASLGNFSRAEESYLQAIHYCGTDRKLDLARLYLGLGSTFSSRFRLAEASQAFEQALGQVQDRQDRRQEQLWMEIRLEQMSMYYYQGLAEKIEREAPAIQPYLNQYASAAERLQFLGLATMASLRRHRYRVVDRFVVENEEKGFRIASASGNPQLIGDRYFTQGMVCWLQGRFEAAVDDFGRGLQIAQQLQFTQLENQCLVYLLAALRQLGTLNTFRQHLPRCRQAAAEVQNLSYLGAAQAHSAWLALQEGDYDQAHREALAAVDIWKDLPSYPFQWFAWTILFDGYIHHQNWPAALHTVRQMDAPLQQWLGEAVHAAFAQAEQRVQKDPSHLPEALLQVKARLAAGHYL